MNYQEYVLHLNADKRFKDIRKKLMSGQPYYDCDIFHILDEKVLGSDKFESTLKPGKTLYRAREIRPEDYTNDKGLSVESYGDTYKTKGYSEQESVEPPIGVVNCDGRNNTSGVSYLYLADNEVTACCEIKSGLRSLISLARFVVDRSLRVIDFSQEKEFQMSESVQEGLSWGEFFTLLMLRYCQPFADKNEYRVTQIISDYIRKAGYDGISYRSFITYGVNYTIFNSHKSNIRFIDSRILSHQFSKEIFWDFNNSKAIQCDDEDLVYDRDVADKMLRNIKRAVEKGSDNKNHEVLSSKTDQLENLFKEWEQAHENESPDYLKKTINGEFITKLRFRRDGIIEETIFSKEKRKVLFVSNEANDDGYTAKYGVEKPNSVLDYRLYAKKGVDDWMGKMRERTSELYKIAAGLPRDSISNSEAALHYAVMDLNKRGGKSSIDNGQHIWNYCSYYKDYIKREIEIINPDIIVWLSTKTFDMGIPRMLGAKGSNDLYFLIEKKKVPIIRMWHTSYIYGTRYVTPLEGYDRINGALCAKLKMEMERIGF